MAESESKLSNAAPLGTTCSNICIMTFLAQVVSPRSNTLTAKDRKRRRVFDYLFSLLLPMIFSSLVVLVQPTRYGIVQTRGCGSTFVNSWPLWTVYLVWQPIFAFTGCLLSREFIFLKLSDSF